MEAIIKETMKEMTAEEKAIFLANFAKASGKGKKSSTSKKKSSFNGASLEIEPTVTEKDGYVVFKHPEYKSGKWGGYAVVDLKEAENLIANIKSKNLNAFDEAKQFSDINVRTKTRFVNVNGVVIGENLVKWAKKAEILN